MVSKTDIIIVGSGASGAAAAWSLSTNTDLDIVCIEQGGEADASNYPSTRVAWEHEKFSTASANPNIRKNSADYPIEDSGSAISLANYNGFGGSTVLYSGHFPRFHPSDFSTYSLDQVGDDWPVTYRELEPFFSLNEKMMGVAGLVGDPAYPEYDQLLPPVPLGLAGKKLAQAFNKLGWHWWPSYSAINTHRHQGRPACINLGPCNTGCAQGAKGSVNETYWPIAKKQGVSVLTNSTVYEIIVNSAKKVTGVKYLDQQGNDHFLQASIVILAASGIGTPKLLLQSLSEEFPNGLLNNNDLVGRNLMLHPLAYIEGVFAEDLGSSIGPQGCCLLSQEFYETAADRNFVRGYTMHILRGTPPLESAMNGYLNRQIPLGKKHHQAFARYFNHNMGIAIISEDLPERHNRVQLDYDNLDSRGLPGLKVTYRLSSNTTHILNHGIEKAKELFIAAGARITTASFPVKHAGWHLMGTARMGTNPATSVVNPQGQAHEVDNLFIVDSSIFVTSGAVNPVATAQALTLKLCDGISQNIHKLVK